MMPFKKKSAEEEAPKTEETQEMNTDEASEAQPAENAENAENTENAEAAESAKPEETELQTAQRKADEYLDMAQRVQAEFDNYRRRTKATRAEAYDEGAREIIKLLLPSLDNLERALAQESADEALMTGVKMVYRQMMDTLEKRGVTVIDRKGEKFDPKLENAVMQGDASEGEPGTVCAVLQKGYQMGENVIRHAMVKVVAE